MDMAEKFYARALIHKILSQAIIETREAIILENFSKARILADLIHNVPLSLNECQSPEDYEATLDRLRKRAEIKKCTKWLEATITSISGFGVQRNRIGGDCLQSPPS